MRFHIERDKRLHPTGRPQQPFKRSRPPAVPSRDEGTADESLMITACYEAHLSMQQMLAVFAEMRGDDA